MNYQGILKSCGSKLAKFLWLWCGQAQTTSCL